MPVETTVTATEGLVLVHAGDETMKLIHDKRYDDWLAVHDDGEEPLHLGNLSNRQIAVDFAQDYFALQAQEREMADARQETPA